ncbi:MAG: SAP domain-containing protein [bacterium]|nr:SAP domain-containing protein [bacterium]
MARIITAVIGLIMLKVENLRPRRDFMKVADAIKEMSTLPLQRIVDSFTKDFPKPDEDQARDIILRNVEELTNSERIATVLRFDGPFSEQIRQRCMLEAFVNRPEWSASEADLVESLQKHEQSVLDTAGEEDCLQYEDKWRVEVLKDVLIAALEDDHITVGELNLLHALRDSLGLSEGVLRILLAHLEHFPQPGNVLHTPKDCSEVLNKLQRGGIVFHCNKADGSPYVIPEEIRDSVMDALGLELGLHAWELLLDNLTVNQLRQVLKKKQLPIYGAKPELKARVISSDMRPSRVLRILSNEELRKLCSSLPGVTVGGTKPQRIERIIGYFANLITREVSDEASPGERYYQYLPELACRDRENLLANQIINKDIDIERGFEAATRFLFESRLGVELMDMEGNEHPDGCIRMGGRRRASGEVLMWDNKSTEGAYSFPPTHLRQFKRYIRDSVDLVECFLVVVARPDDSAIDRVWQLAAQCDTHIAVIAAEDLGWVAEEWWSRHPDERFNLEVLNMTGILNRPILEQRMKLFA